MKRLWWAALAAMALMVPGLASAQARYSVKTTGDVVQLRDSATNTTISVLTPVNNAYEMVVNGKNVIRMAIKSVDEMRARPGQNGVPFLAPWANRLDELGFYANGRKYNFDMELGNVRGPVPSQGFLMGANAWKVLEAKADANGAWVTSKLDFYKNPQYMAQWPFAHTITMTYRLSGGVMEVRTRIDNLGDEPMPVVIGFHPYFQLTDSGRNDWTLSVPGKTHWLLDQRVIPTGETEPSTRFWGVDDLTRIPMKLKEGKRLDDVFTDFDRDAQGRATVSMTGVKQKVSVILGPKIKTVLVYSTAAPAPPPAPPAAGAPAAGPPRPPGPAPAPVSVGPPIPLSATEGEPAPDSRGFIAFEPMVAITNALNAAQKGQYKDLQTVAPGAFWQESFWVAPTGF
jgi:aldose 1-epimerase